MSNTPGKVVARSSGKRGVLANGKAAAYNSSGTCPDCCGGMYMLTPCSGTSPILYTQSNLSAYVGKAVKLTTPGGANQTAGICYLVSVYTGAAQPWVPVSVFASYDSCSACAWTCADCIAAGLQPNSYVITLSGLAQCPPTNTADPDGVQFPQVEAQGWNLQNATFVCTRQGGTCGYNDSPMACWIGGEQPLKEMDDNAIVAAACFMYGACARVTFGNKPYPTATDTPVLCIIVDVFFCVYSAFTQYWSGSQWLYAPNYWPVTHTGFWPLCADLAGDCTPGQHFQGWLPVDACGRLTVSNSAPNQLYPDPSSACQSTDYPSGINGYGGTALVGTT